MSLVSNRPERTQPGTTVYFGGRALTIDRCRPHGDKYLVGFAGLTTRDAVEDLRGVIHGDPLTDDEELWVHDLIGAVVIDGDIDRGTVVAVQANPAADLLVLDDDTLVPATFIERIDGERIIIDAPAGLFDLG